MKINEAYRAVYKARNYCDHNQKKSLTQQERKLLLICCATLQNPTKGTLTLQQSHQLKYLLKRLDALPTKPCDTMHPLCRWFYILLKKIANLCHLRISLSRLENTLEDTFYTYMKIEPNLLEKFIHIKAELDANENELQTYKILKSIESFCLLSACFSPINKIFLQGEPPHTIRRLIYDKTGLKLDKQPLNAKTIEAISKAPQILYKKYCYAHRKGITDLFFKKAFNEKDKNFQTKLNRLHAFKAKKEKKLRGKEELIWKTFEKFIKEVEMHTTSNRKENNFYVDFASRAKFNDYLRREQFIGKKYGKNNIKKKMTYEKMIKLEKYLAGLLNIWEGQVNPNIPLKPLLNRPNFNHINFFNPIAKPLNFLPIIANNKPTAIAPPPQEKILVSNKLNALYLEMLKDLDHIHDTGNLRAYDHIKQTIHGFFKIYSKRFQLWDYYLKHSFYDSGTYIYDLTGVYLHTEQSKETIKFLIKTSAKLFFTTYQKAKANDRLKEFFNQAFSSYNYCLEARYTYLCDNWVASESQSECIGKEPLAEIMKINPHLSKEKNIEKLVEIFEDLQAREYAKDHGIKIDKVWNKPEGPKHHKIFKDKKFNRYYNVHNFEQALLRGMKIVGQKCANGIYTEKEVKELIQKMVDADIID
ncbi:hypothetical protein NEOC84_000948|uniref:hypothetical protein n=1 Tax=Neochlamydia sp. AcF84 TaxID=2315858 RepID=UPI00140D45CB|nr:hypothetical protein [Neochlamydia sp. AcF84]NGY95040.1 hypothetical protein [Neochlamydia sp. AcF84]